MTIMYVAAQFLTLFLKQIKKKPKIAKQTTETQKIYS